MRSTTRLLDLAEKTGRRVHLPARLDRRGGLTSSSSATSATS
ncbi:MAG: hypothetical protein R3F34_06900 [Planctomycetota bacterium]